MNEWDGNESSCSCDCGFDIPKGGKLDALTLVQALGIESGGTGAKTVAEARVNLGIQCGYATIPVSGLESFEVASSSMIIFPTEFKSTPYVAIAPVHAQYSGCFVYTISDGSATGFRLRATNITTSKAGSIPARGVHWIAIGEM